MNGERESAVPAAALCRVRELERAGFPASSGREAGERSEECINQVVNSLAIN